MATVGWYHLYSSRERRLSGVL